MRRSALLLKINRKTVARRLPFLADGARVAQQAFLKRYEKKKALSVQFDDLETFEHSKHRPVSVALAVEQKTRVILGFSLSQMPAKGVTASYSREKYGPRADRRPEGWNLLFSELKRVVAPDAYFLSDQNPHYPHYVKKFFPLSQHRTVKGGRGAIRGQGELKKVTFDPLFSLNHTFAMLRANISRLIRKTWCTTKKMDRLADHIALYVSFHNRKLLKPPLKAHS